MSLVCFFLVDQTGGDVYVVPAIDENKKDVTYVIIKPENINNVNLPEGATIYEKTVKICPEFKISQSSNEKVCLKQVLS